MSMLPMRISHSACPLHLTLNSHTHTHTRAIAHALATRALGHTRVASSSYRGANGLPLARTRRTRAPTEINEKYGTAESNAHQPPATATPSRTASFYVACVCVCV